MNSPAGKIAFVEMHDMRVESASIGTRGHVALGLAHVAVYHELSEGLYDVWSYRAVIQCRGVVRLELKGLLDDKEDYVSDGVICDDEDRRIELTNLLKGASVKSLELVFGSGTTVQIHASHLRVDLIEPLKKLEQWRGPLAG